MVVVDEIPVKPNNIPDRGDLQNHDYLRGVDLPRVEGATVTLLTSLKPYELKLCATGAMVARMQCAPL